MKTVYVAGTCDSKGPELEYAKSEIARLGVPTLLVDLSTQTHPGKADISAKEVAQFHPGGEAAVFTGDRGQSVQAMALAFEQFMTSRADVGGLLGLGGSGGTALITPAMRALPIGIAKLMVSTMASGNVGPYVGASDIAMMYSVTDVSGLNRVSRQVIGNAAHAVAGMVQNPVMVSVSDKPAVGLTMFGLTTPCVQAVQARLEATHDCLVFHATGTGGMSMEKLLDNGLLSGLVDLTTTEVADMLVGGVLACTPDRFGATIRSKAPYVGSCGALDMVNFGAKETVPEGFKQRKLYVHNPQITLMRTTPEENAKIGAWIAERLNQCLGEVRFLIPEGGVSSLDAPGMPFYDPEADAALFEALEKHLKPSEKRRLIRLPHHINAPEFAEAALKHYLEIAPLLRSERLY